MAFDVVNNSRQGPQDLDLDVYGEEGLVFFTVTDGDTGKIILEITSDVLSSVLSFADKIKTEAEEAFS